VITLFRDINRGKEVIEMAKDPVCKMEVDEKTAAATSALAVKRLSMLIQRSTYLNKGIS
jgi:hypothetical protein